MGSEQEEEEDEDEDEGEEEQEAQPSSTWSGVRRSGRSSSRRGEVDTAAPPRRESARRSTASARAEAEVEVETSVNVGYGSGGGRGRSSRGSTAAAVAVAHDEGRPRYRFRDRTTIKRTEFLTYAPVSDNEGARRRVEGEADRQGELWWCA